MKKSSLIVALILFMSGTAMAQYDFAVGVRSGGTSGLTLKKNYGPSAIEGIVGFWHDGLSLTALWEKNRMAFDEPGLFWYYGVGGHVSIYGDDFDGHGGPGWYKHPHGNNDGDLGLGVDGIVGLEYKIPQAPIAFSLDFKPYLEVVTDGGAFFAIDPGLGIKVAF